MRQILGPDELGEHIPRLLQRDSENRRGVEEGRSLLVDLATCQEQAGDVRPFYREWGVDIVVITLALVGRRSAPQGYSEMTDPALVVQEVDCVAGENEFVDQDADFRRESGEKGRFLFRLG